MTTILRITGLLLSALWLALAGVILPVLAAADEFIACGHVAMLALFALAAIVWLTKPAAKPSRGVK